MQADPPSRSCTPLLLEAGGWAVAAGAGSGSFRSSRSPSRSCWCACAAAACPSGRTLDAVPGGYTTCIQLNFEPMLNRDADYTHCDHHQLHSWWYLLPCSSQSSSVVTLTFIHHSAALQAAASLLVLVSAYARRCRHSRQAHQVPAPGQRAQR